uniref:Transmembrane protein n=1 Tax=Romanomermis culicivorax TaxID=13658 RepID=A0A915IWK8_ROMCU
MATTIPVTPMAITTTAMAKKTATAATITSNPDPHQTPVIIAAIDPKLLYSNICFFSFSLTSIIPVVLFF